MESRESFCGSTCQGRVQTDAMEAGFIIDTMARKSIINLNSNNKMIRLLRDRDC